LGTLPAYQKELPAKVLETRVIQGPERSDKPYKLFDERGLFLLVTPTGGKWWRLKYRFDGKEKQLSLGGYPGVSLNDARRLRDEARRLLACGTDPSKARREAKTRERAERLAAESRPQVSVAEDGVIELRKGRAMVRLSMGEARFVHNILSRLLGG
jgi:hypothetical protein